VATSAWGVPGGAVRATGSPGVAVSEASNVALFQASQIFTFPPAGTRNRLLLVVDGHHDRKKGDIQDIQN